MKPVESACSCQLSPGEYGAHGWHWRVNKKHPDHPQVAAAFERCPPYMEALIAARRSAEQERAA
jgi:hypothetical protein